MKKLPNKVTTEELLKALESSPEESKEVLEVFEYRNDVPQFLNHYGIDSGEHQISIKYLYNLYLQFTTAKVTRKAFSMSLFQFLPRATPYAYYVNKSKAEITALMHKKNRANGRYHPAHIGTRKHFEGFLEVNKVSPGNKWVESFVLYEVYKKWCRENRKSIRFKSNTFITICKLYLPDKRTTMISTWFRIDESILEVMTPEFQESIRQKRRKRLDEAKKQKESSAKG